MLRRKLLLLLGSLVALLLVTAFSAIFILTDVVEDLSRITTAGLERNARLADIATTITSIEARLDDVRLHREHHLDELLVAVRRLEAQVDEFQAPPDAGPETAAALAQLRAVLPVFVRHAGEIATTRVRDTPGSGPPAEEALASSLAMRDAIATINQELQAATHVDEQRLVARFRSTVLALGLVFLVLINVTILVLLRAASMTLRPVEALVDASRHLAREDFEHRVEMEQDDEFGELARAYNSLAEQLRLNEHRKVETLHQVARTLSHELNNAISIIDLQLELVARSAGDAPAQGDRLEQIHATLHRMSGIVEDLTRVRRIVLTDYLDGVKMLDLQRSVEEAPPEPAPVAEIRSDTSPA